MSTRAGWSVVVADATLLLFLNPSLEIFTFQLKKQNNTNEVIFIQESDVSLAVILFYGVETHAEINHLPHRKRLFTGTVPLIQFVLIGAVPIKNCNTKRASLKKLLTKGYS